MIVLNSIKSFYWGLLSYEEADRYQVQAWDIVKSKGHAYILGGEIKTVVTKGLRGGSADVLNPDLKPINTRRGGETTLHSPGQLVIYPVLPLRGAGLGVKSYVEILLETSVETFKVFGVPAYTQMDPLGVWTEKGKIGFCGVQVKQGITQHGLALNLSNDLNLFSQIVSCGLSNASYDCARNYVSVKPQEFFKHWVYRFGQKMKNNKLEIRPGQ